MTNHLKNNIYLYNSLSKKKEAFKSIKKNNVSFYVCGVTVYDHCHMGHARAYIAFDCMRRYLEHTGYQVHYIQNFTDIDDKIIKRCHEEEKSLSELTETYIQSFFKDMRALNIKDANHYPKATQSISSIIKMITLLIDKGYAYINKKQDVCYSVRKFKNYGKLSKRNLDDLRSGSRINIDDSKNDPLDFVLWKQCSLEPNWDSPWGKGRPGWHIECSAMIHDNLDGAIDIHGGGLDLIFPHHENEIAQSEACYKHRLANYWVHNAFVQKDGEKMSKSMKNFFLIKEALKEFSGNTIRLFFMKHHYRTPINLSHESLVEAQVAYKRLVSTFNEIPKNPSLNTFKSNDILKKYESAFHDEMCDDFNTAGAIGKLFELCKEIRKNGHGHNLLWELSQLLGLNLKESEDASSEPLSKDPNLEIIQSLIKKRWNAKQTKDFQTADTLRTLLENKYGVILEDTRSTTKWRKKNDS